MKNSISSCQYICLSGDMQYTMRLEISNFSEYLMWAILHAFIFLSLIIMPVVALSGCSSGGGGGSDRDEVTVSIDGDAAPERLMRTATCFGTTIRMGGFASILIMVNFLQGLNFDLKWGNLGGIALT